MIANSRLKPIGLPNELSNLDRCLVVGVLNVTPDSFSDGGKFLNKKTAIEQAKKLISDGADLIDIGGESTRPGAEQISIDEEIQRVIPVIAELKKEKIFIFFTITNSLWFKSKVVAKTSSGLSYRPEKSCL